MRSSNQVNIILFYKSDDEKIYYSLNCEWIKYIYESKLTDAGGIKIHIVHRLN